MTNQEYARTTGTPAIRPSGMPSRRTGAAVSVMGSPPDPGPFQGDGPVPGGFVLGGSVLGGPVRKGAGEDRIFKVGQRSACQGLPQDVPFVLGQRNNMWNSNGGNA